jgi:hypothetical protein
MEFAKQLSPTTISRLIDGDLQEEIVHVAAILIEIRERLQLGTSVAIEDVLPSVIGLPDPLLFNKKNRTIFFAARQACVMHPSLNEEEQVVVALSIALFNLFGVAE